MSGEVEDEDRSRVTADAAAWLARLQNEDRTPAAEAAFEAWLATTPGATEAFDRVSGVWDILPDAAPLARIKAANDTRAAPKARRFFLPAVAAALIATIGLGIYAFQSRAVVYETRPGQQRTLTLSDGSRVMLNTDTEVQVRYSGARRQINLTHGEALFEVRHDAARPFLVRAGDEQVRALGTVFVVRREPESVAVTLLKGKVEVAPLSKDPDAAVILSPGERATVRDTARPVLDRPAVATVTAWRRGEIIFSDTSLAEAVGEINRYSTTRIVLSDRRMAALRVSGVFQAQDTAEFAATVAQLNGLRVRREGDTLRLTY
ncbi:FecR family protein [Asticcacaulis sp. BYS171W]|uniref:FecR family protein n=1 Tax=Asticcacaulis aquaticus TaxID=2984212 RepID=A0ABT5HWT4_9CAUL|nr:FecR family protein [Asticcacaulis aquaticus]